MENEQTFEINSKTEKCDHIFPISNNEYIFDHFIITINEV